MKAESLTQELVRSLRGDRSQLALSRHLRFRTNVLYAWESGRNVPTAGQLMLLAERARVDVRGVFGRFNGANHAWLTSAPLDELPRHLLHALRGEQPLGELAQNSGLSRFALSRIFKNEAQLKASDFLLLVHVCSHRLVDFVAGFASPNDLPSIRPLWLQQEARRAAATQAPWSLAVCAALELAEYQKLARHDSGWLAERLGIDVGAVDESLRLLTSAGQIRRRHHRYEPVSTLAVNLNDERAVAKQRREFWSGVAATRARAGHGMVAFNVCAVSQADLLRLQALQREYLARARAIIAESQPVESVALLQINILDLTNHAMITNSPK